MDGALTALSPAKLPDHVGPCYFRRLGAGWLLTNDWGHHARLGQKEFEAFFAGAPDKEAPWFKELLDKGFVRDHLDFRGLAGRFASQNSYLWSGPRLHIAVLTTRCNQGCGYCQAGSSLTKGKGSDMSLDTARKVVEFAFRSPVPEMTIEFQGGEPLLNWEVLEFVTRYAREFAQTSGRTLRLAVVTNLTLLDDDKLAFLMENRVGICTSLDGPAAVHDRNRPWFGGSAHAEAVRWLKAIAERYPDAPGVKHPRPNALLTVTRASLPHAEAIVDEYARLGLSSLFARPLSPFGAAKRSWKALGVSVPEFLDFYRRCLDRAVALSLSGTPMRERGAAMLLTKILRNRDPGFTDLRSPCGAGFGQLAYDHDGSVFTCDEGRLLAAEGEGLLRLGSVFDTPYEDAVQHPTVRACAVASNLEDQPVCSSCAYRPYCGVCPAYNFAAQDTIWGRMPTNDRCAVYQGMFDLIFERLGDEKARPVLESWAGDAQACGPECAGFAEG